MNYLAALSNEMQKYGPSPYSDKLVEISAKCLSQAVAIATIEDAKIDTDVFYNIITSRNVPKLYAPLCDFLNNFFNPMKIIYEIAAKAYMLFSDALVRNRLLTPNDYIWGVSAYFAPWKHIELFASIILSMSDYNMLSVFHLAKIKQEHIHSSAIEINNLSSENLFGIIDYETLCDAVRLDLEKRFLATEDIGYQLYISNTRQLTSVFRLICYKVGVNVLDLGIFPKIAITLPEEPRLCAYNYDCENCPHALTLNDDSYADGIDGFD